MKLMSMLSTVGVVGLATMAVADPVRGILIPDWSNDRIYLLSREDGSIINNSLVNDTATGMPALSSPKKAKRVGSEIWVSDQVENAIRRYSLDGQTYLGDFANQAGQGIQNVRGFEVAFGRVYIACDTGTFADKVAIFNLGDSSLVGSVAVVDPWDVLRVGNELLVTMQTSDNIIRLDADGTILGNFVTSTSNNPLDWPQGMSRKGDEIYVGNFNIPSTGSLKIFNLSGSLVGSAVTNPNNGLRGAWRLDNGNLIWTNGSGAWVRDDNLGLTLNAMAGTNAQYINAFNSCAADFNDDGVVDFFDYLDFVAAFSSNDWDADFNVDGVVDFFDYLDFVADFSSGC